MQALPPVSSYLRRPVTAARKTKGPSLGEGRGAQGFVGSTVCTADPDVTLQQDNHARGSRGSRIGKNQRKQPLGSHCQGLITPTA